MMHDLTLPEENDLYKTFKIDIHTFEIRYGYYEENERGRVEPLPVFPDFEKNPIYTSWGEPVTALVQVPCEHYSPRIKSSPEGWCSDCLHYGGGKEEMGICLCGERKRE